MTDYRAVICNGITWVLVHPRMPFEALGFLPDFFNAWDERPAREQIKEHYGWSPIPGLTLLEDDTLTFPGDPPFMPAAKAKLRDEVLAFYPVGRLLAIIQPDRSFEVARVD